MDRRDTRRRYLGLVATGAGAALSGCSALSLPQNGDGDETEEATDTPEPVDDWQYDPGQTERERGGGGGLLPSFGLSSGSSASGGAGASADMASSGGDGGGTIGLAAGGAKRIAAFRRNVEEGYLPQPESLAYEGLFYNYYFDTGATGGCESLFCPTYSPAVTADLLSSEIERYLTVGLDSGIAKRDFDRKRLNLVVVLDVSGSMSSPFDEYYYDQFGNEKTPEGNTDTPKIEVARRALVTLTEQLRPDDRLGVVLYSSRSAVAKPLRRVGETDMDAIRGHIREDVQAGGGTNLDAGFSDATDLLTEYSDADQSEVENRMMVLTDAMPNVGQTSDEGLRQRLAENTERNVHATFVGVGLDFNTELVDELTSVRGANYYSVHSADEFERRVGEEFEYMVTPLVFDLDLELEADGYDIKRVYGSTAADEATGQLMHVNTLFASPSEDGKSRGGVVLVQVERTGESGQLRLNASWETRAGESQRATETVRFPDGGPEQFANTGVRKAVLLSRYADLLKNWILHEANERTVAPDDGIDVPPTGLGRWEQQSEPLTVTEPYPSRLESFRSHLESEMATIGDDSLERELEIIDRILEQA